MNSFQSLRLENLKKGVSLQPCCSYRTHQNYFEITKILTEIANRIIKNKYFERSFSSVHNFD